MIIDADTHISPFSDDALDIPIDELLRRLDRAKVDKAIVWQRPPYMREVAEANRYVYQAMKDHPDRVIGFGWVNPHLGTEKMLDEIKRCHEAYGMHGIKLNGAQNSFYIDSDAVMPLLDAIAATDTVMAFHIGTDAYEATHPYRMGKIAARYPDKRLLMIHMGGVGFHDLSNAAIEVMQTYDNIMGIGSAIRPIKLLKALKTLGAERVAFGSDTPFNLTHVEVAAYQALLEDEFTENEKQQIMAGNIARWLNLDL
ncbi:amidohydrolase family protein [Phototrophicus methaneseepsis]|uniref:Amidohydrolase family protein n=1 Tax=Phototrophicus methaneseepsis TaxID=2710758 RepID=A0A7S8EB74_9CHLR|nr:amidohydrolase family protein [Phototrophicus methaneseepsis]QPC83724.1 amidohydrolase family protein [Phototrophicus methaneseepsis]